MLYYLFRFLDQFGIPGAHVWSYISFRSLMALVLSLIISAWFGEKFIKYLRRKQIAETQPLLSKERCYFMVEDFKSDVQGQAYLSFLYLFVLLFFHNARNLLLLLFYHY